MTREELMDELECLMIEYKDIPSAVVVFGALGAAVNERIDASLAGLVWAWTEEHIKPRLKQGTNP